MLRLYELRMKQRQSLLSESENAEWTKSLEEHPEDSAFIVRITQDSPLFVPPDLETQDSDWERFKLLLSEDQPINQHYTQSKSQRKGRYWLWGILIVLGLFSAWWIWRLSHTAQDTSPDFKKEVLNDRSQITINDRSHIQYDKSYGIENRKLKMEGEVYIIAAKSSVPMQLTSPTFEIEVIGTKLNVMDYAMSKLSSISLFEGTIEVVLPDSQTVTLQAGQHLTWNHQLKSISIRPIDSTEPDWLSHDIVFENAPLIEVFTTLANRFNVQFDGIESLRAIHFSGEFRQAVLSDILPTVSKTSGIQIVQLDDTHYRIEQ